jgi:hypothetical protein
MLTLGCASAPQPRFASWDPVLETIPPVPSRAEAAQRLETSRLLWRQWLTKSDRFPSNLWRGWLPPAPAPAYSYVRARQISATRVGFTLLVVAAGTVVMRAYLSADPQRTSSLPRILPAERDVKTSWVERAASLGTHAEGAPLKTIDALYADCARLIATADAEALPRLYFHPNGLLMQCGQAPSACSGCESYSIQDVSHFSLLHEQPDDDAKLWTCATEAGLMLPLSPAMHGALSCFPAYQVDPTFAAKQAAEAARRLELERCANDLEPSCPEDDNSSGVDICQIDPAACRIEKPYRASWTVLHAPACSEPLFARPLGALDVGKSAPDDVWTFPVVAAPCGLDRRAHGQGYLRFVRQADGSFGPVFGP